MFEKGYFAHTNLEGKSSSDRMKDGDVEFNMAGENLALSKDLPSAHQGLMNSPGHKKNILHQWTDTINHRARFEINNIPFLL